MTPAEKYAKRPDKFLVKDRIVSLGREDDDRVDESTVSYAPPVKEEEATDPVESIKSEEDDFEQISLFDEEEETDKASEEGSADEAISLNPLDEDE